MTNSLNLKQQTSASSSFCTLDMIETDVSNWLIHIFKIHPKSYLLRQLRPMLEHGPCPTFIKKTACSWIRPPFVRKIKCLGKIRLPHDNSFMFLRLLHGLGMTEEITIRLRVVKYFTCFEELCIDSCFYLPIILINNLCIAICTRLYSSTCRLMIVFSF